MAGKLNTKSKGNGPGKPYLDEERYRDLIDILSDAVWEVDREGCYTYLTENVASFTGYASKDLIGKSVYSIMWPSDVEPFRDMFHEVWQKRETFRNVVYRIRAKSGRQIHVQVSGVPIVDGENHLVGYRGTCQDVTEQQETLEALKNAHDELLARVEGQRRDFDEEAKRASLLMKSTGGFNEDFNRLLKDVKQWYWETDTKGCLTVMTGGWAEMAHKGHDWFMGKEIPDVVRHWKSPEVWKKYRSLVKAREPIRDLVFEELNLEGEECYVRISGSPKYDKSHCFLGYQGWCVDVTKEFEAVHLAEEQKKRLAEAIDHMDEGMLLLDPNDRVITFNREYAEQVAALKIELKAGMPFEDILRASLREGQVSDAIGREDAWLVERQELRKNRLPLPAIRNSDGKWFETVEYETQDGGTLAFRRDVTAARNREHALYRAKDDAELANRTKSEFLANMSHELRTPLNAIIGFSDVMVHEMFGPVGVETYKEYHLAIRDSGQHLLDLIRDILDLSRIEAGVMELEETNVNVVDIVSKCMLFFEDQAKEKGVQLTSEVPETFSYLRGDPRRLRQIIINLVSNALKFTPSGGKVSLQVYEKLDQAIFKVTDTGVGIAEEDIARVFETFTQLQGPLTRENEGTGLGLPLTQSLVDLHDGTIHMTSKVGRGTQVIVAFPGSRIIHQNEKLSAN